MRFLRPLLLPLEQVPLSEPELLSEPVSKPEQRLRLFLPLLHHIHSHLL